MTRRGYDKLSDDLHRLKTVERPNIIKAIALAREQGDLSENAEYLAAREQQSFIEGRIASFESKLQRSEIIDILPGHGEKIVFGATVALNDDETGDTRTYRIVGSDEADVSQGLLSITSPLARSLIGKKIGQEIDVQAPSGTKYFIIQDVRYGHFPGDEDV